MYRWVDHTAEVELAIEAPNEREVFADAAAALAELLGVGGGAAQATARRTVSVHATDRPALLAAWLEELVFLAESQGFVATELLSLELDQDSGLRATVAGVLDDPSPIVKAVTYHRLTFEPGSDGYTASVVLDV
jgi:SHS2 domain-containing protein